MGHGKVTVPSPRSFGSATEAACGSAVLNELTADLTGPIENSVKVEDADFNATACPLFFCRGAAIEDNLDNIQQFSPGEIVNMQVDIVVRHTGLANVSVVDLANQNIIGDFLFDWPVYANQSLTAAQAPANETNFNVTIPDLGTQCSEAGACALQWWWLGDGDQTYESCVDFTQ
ncbi:uncharacterized protein STEHIDRAFT_46186 [Stereum hirsutum FP-91666 SS1]|uniref:uncharacterized protein n=1 Tax=Stereum hirsutum (strain FP-91666) TaxID=721885 RepID=UPI000440CA6A|nr:uncharacterized protein STEHIDRAFT_46186 [Stereum hirsutum FP-91666 SS1]EIM92384.1 hypothetical protein STEHIDRAFT_46186 [Stereum hirsutum FP-91666 SS1]